MTELAKKLWAAYLACETWESAERGSVSAEFATDRETEALNASHAAHECIIDEVICWGRSTPQSVVFASHLAHEGLIQCLRGEPRLAAAAFARAKYTLEPDLQIGFEQVSRWLGFPSC